MSVTAGKIRQRIARAILTDIVVVGTGYFGRMAVSEEARRYLEAQGIAVHTTRTRQAVQDFNQLQSQRARVVAALHVTC